VPAEEHGRLRGVFRMMRLLRWIRERGWRLQELTHRDEVGFAACVAEESIVADAVKALRQHVQ
jgi:hypothetical protein